MSKPKGQEQKKAKPLPKGLECYINLDVPPRQAPFGSLAPKPKEIIPGSPLKKKESTFSLDKNTPPPKGLEFPYLENSPSMERILKTHSQVHEGAGNVMGKIEVGHLKLVFPGWLIQLDDAVLKLVMNIRDLLQQGGQKICDVVGPLSNAVGELGVGISKEDVVEVLRRIPQDENGWSFPHFMLGVGSPKLAREKGVFGDPVPFKAEDCPDYEEGNGAKPSKSKSKTNQAKQKKMEALDKLVNPYGYETQDTWPMPPKQTKPTDKCKDNNKVQATKSKANVPPAEPQNGVDPAGYSAREKLFFSALLTFEMYHTIRAVEEIYFQSDSIPIPEGKIQEAQARRGFGIESAGSKKRGFAEWDRPLPPLPKKSPYEDNLTLVATRWKITRPNEVERTRRRTLTQLQPLHLAINTPDKPKGDIKVTENQARIKKTMDFLASQGNVVAALPHISFIVHLSDTFIERLEQTNVHAIMGSLEEIKPSNDMTQLKGFVHDFFFLHGLPDSVNKMKFLVDFNCAMCLRKICTHIREEHWGFVLQRNNVFRNKAWELMHTERIPCGPLRENFVYTFNSYLPYRSHVPVDSKNAPMPYSGLHKHNYL